MEMQGKVAVITGSGKGIGRATALAFAKEGYNVVLVSRTESDLKKVAREVELFGVNALAIRTDVGSAKDAKNLIEKAIKKFSRINFLINNAGTWYSKSLDESTIDEIDEQIDTNLKGVLYYTKFVLPHMMKNKSGIIVNISSGAGHYAFADLATYCATKFAVNAITKSVAKEVGKYGIKVYSVCPGMVATSAQERNIGKTRFAIAKHAMIKPEKIANKILELCKGKVNISSGDCIDVYF